MTTETVTVMFTDLVESTALASRVGEEQAETLRREHVALLREAIAAAGGREVKSVGDGVMVVFRSSDAAADAAVRMQHRFEARNRRAEHPFLVRIGIALGNADVDENDYFGPPVVEAARLCAAAAGGQILTTEIVRTLTGTRGSHRFESVGTLELKGLEDPVAAWSIAWEREATQTSDAPVPLPTRLLRDGATGFVGRDDERSKLLTEVKEATSDRAGRLVLIGGEPGIGKTTLAAEVTRELHDTGAVVLYGRSDEDVGIPYQPWVEALGHLVEFAPDALLDQYAAERGDELASLVPALVRRRPGLARSRTGDPAAERHLLFGAVHALLRAASSDAPVVVVLDDLHWADKPTLLLLRHLASSADYPLVVIGTFRESEVGSGDALADALAALHREPRVSRMSLRGLADAELIELMEVRAGHEMTDQGIALAQALRRETDGNPFFVGEMLLHLAETGAIFQRDGRWVGRDDLRTIGLPVSVREVIGRRVARLGNTTVRALSVAAVIGRDFDASLVSRVTGLDEDELADLLDVAVANALVEEVPATPGRYTFVHALIEHTLYDSLGANRRARVHRQVAEAIEELTDDPRDRITELAYHWTEATASQDARKTIDYVRVAGTRALEQIAADEALRWFGQALELYDSAGLADERLRCELLVGLGTAESRVGAPHSRESLLAAARLAQDVGHVDMLVSAALANSRLGGSDARGIDRERVTVLEAALEATERDTDRARVLATLAAELTFGGDFPKRLALADDALSLARKTGDPETVAYVLARRNSSVGVPSLLDDNERLVDELADLAIQIGDPALQFGADGERVACALSRGDTDTVAVLCADRVEFAARLGVPPFQLGAALHQAIVSLLRGDITHAERTGDEVLRLGTETGQPDVMAVWGAQLIAARWHQGRLAELEPMIAQVAADTPGVPAFVAELAHCRVEAGDADGATDLLATATSDGFASVPYDGVWSTTLVLWSEVAAALDRTEPAVVLFDLLRPYAHQVVFNGASVLGPVADYLGTLATVLGRYDDAERYFDEAMDIHERFKAPFFLARTHLHRAELARRRGRSTDELVVRELAGKALALANEFGYAGVERAAHALAL